MDYNAIEKLIDKVSESTLTSLEVETDGVKIVLKKEIEKVVVAQQQQVVPTVSVPVQQAPIGNVEQSREQAPVVESASADDSNVKIIKSPMVGTFYKSPSPDAPAYAKVGDIVNKGDVLCILEAMKLMNEIESEFDGEIVEILVDNEQMVEFGQPLFKIK